MQVHKECYQCKLVYTGISGVGGGGALAPPLGFKVSIAHQNFGQFLFWGGNFAPLKCSACPPKPPFSFPSHFFFLETVKKEINSTIYVETFFLRSSYWGQKNVFNISEDIFFWGGGDQVIWTKNRHFLSRKMQVTN